MGLENARERAGLCAPGKGPRNQWAGKPAWLAPLLPLLFAILSVQAIFWLAIEPTLIHPAVPPFDRIAADNARFAVLQGPDRSSLDRAEFVPLESLGEGECCEKGYSALRYTIDLKSVPETGLAFLDNLQTDNAATYVNGQLAYRWRRMVLPDITYDANDLKIRHVPPALLRLGENRIEHVMVRSAAYEAYPAPSLIGDAEVNSQAFAWKAFLVGPFKWINVAVGLVVALFALIFMVRGKDRAVAFWLFALAFAWSLRTQFFMLADPPFGGSGRVFYVYALLTFIPIAWLNLADRWTGRPIRWLAAVSLAAWSAALAAIAWWVFGLGSLAGAIRSEQLINYGGLAIVTAASARIVWHVVRIRDPRHWEAALLIAFAVLVVLQLVWELVWHINMPYLTNSESLLILALVAAFFGRNVRLFQSAESIATLLANRLEAREAELADAHARELGLHRREAHQEERERIMRDMHDGMGSQLMSLLMAARRGAMDTATMAEGIQSVIDELRLMINSMASAGDSLTASLLLFQQRASVRVRDAGFAFDWRDDRPEAASPPLSPRHLLDVFRILQEAVANALRHSGGDRITVRVSEGESAEYAVAIEVADNGRGTQPEHSGGRGLENMATRARLMGARLEFTGNDAGGTIVSLAIPARPVAVASPDPARAAP